MTSTPSHARGPASLSSEEIVMSLVAGKTRRVFAGAIEQPLDLYEDLGFDSTDIIEVIMAIERALHIQLADIEAAKIRTVADLLRVVQHTLPPHAQGGAAN
jgi:acyl carrier protein